MRSLLPLLLSVILPLAGCGREKPVEDRRSAAEAPLEVPPADGGSEDLSADLPEEEPYEPPADGRLLAAQLEAFLAVRRRAAELDPEEPFADRRRTAAEELGVSPAELAWVEGEVLAVLAARAEASALDRLAADAERYQAIVAGEEEGVDPERGTAAEPPTSPLAGDGEPEPAAPPDPDVGLIEARLEEVLAALSPEERALVAPYDEIEVDEASEEPDAGGLPSPGAG